MSKGNGHDPESSHDLLDVTALEGDGSVEMVIFHRDDQVIMRFREKMLWVGFDPANAAAAGEKLINLAVVCGANVKIVGLRQQVTREQRDRLTVRTAHIFRSMTAGGRRPEFIAQQVVDTILSELG